jgi:hypothetical protein
MLFLRMPDLIEDLALFVQTNPEVRQPHALLPLEDNSVSEHFQICTFGINSKNSFKEDTDISVNFMKVLFVFKKEISKNVIRYTSSS